jgi:predicted transcriptional regulator
MAEVAAVITVDTVCGHVAAGSTTVTALARAFSVPADDDELREILRIAVSSCRLRTWTNRDSVAQYQVVPTGTVKPDTLEYVRAQRLRRLVSATDTIAEELQQIADRVRHGGTLLHSSTLTNMAGRLSDLAATAASIELIDTILQDADRT